MVVVVVVTDVVVAATVVDVLPVVDDVVVAVVPAPPLQAATNSNNTDRAVRERGVVACLTTRFKYRTVVEAAFRQVIGVHSVYASISRLSRKL